MTRAISRFWAASSIVLGCLATLAPARAQIVPDNTLPVNSIVTPGCTICVIDGGTVRGTNLFHSFQSFSVPTDGEAFFNNAEQIQNILTRVTGNSVSNLEGVISANGTANLFLLNPNGISFGARARLNLGGSFFASTASSLVFADGTVFSTKPVTSTPPLLTVSVPLGLQYESHPGSIQVQGATLEVGIGQTLALVGGNVQLKGGRLYTPAEPPGGHVELGGLAGEGTVGLVANGPNLGLSFPVGVPRGDVSLSNGAVVDVVADNGGSIGINARNLTMTQESGLLAGIASGRGAVDAVAGNIEINTTGAIKLTDSDIFNRVRRRSQGQGGDVNITTSQLRVSGGSQVSATTYAEGNGGNLTVNASKDVQLIGTSADGQYISGLFTQASAGASGNAGDMTINTGTLLVQDGARVNAGTSSQGDGGDLTVNASKEVQLIGTSADGQYASGLFAEAEQGSSGKVGDLTINTSTLLVRDGAAVSASTWGEGNGGNLTVNADQGVQVMGESADDQTVSGLFAQTSAGASGNAGDVTINTGTLLVRDGAQVSAGTKGEGNGGNLTVNASQGVQVMGESADGQASSGLFTHASAGSSGNAGDLTINTDTLLVRDGAQVSASTFGQGDGGNLTVNASKDVQVIGRSVHGRAGNGLFAQANQGASGNAGNLIINTDTLLVRDGAQVGTGTFGQGNGGNLTVNASKDVQVIGTSADGRVGSNLFASAQANASGKAGDVTINTGTLLVRDGAQVNAGTKGEGNGGNLTVNASKDVQVIGESADGQHSSSLWASAQEGTSGKAGDLTINTGSLLVRDGAQVSASTFGQGNGGNLTVNASKDVQLIGETADGQTSSGLYAQANPGASGKAGDLTINTDTLLVRDGGLVSVRSVQGQAGNMTIRANSVFLNQGTLVAETRQSDAQGGANIILSDLEFLRMDNESLISASARGNANGGNVTINSTLIAATPPIGPEGSDIIANAEQGNGGRVNITTQGLFGIQFRPQRTPKNDITVSSTYGISGEYTLNTPGVDPSRGLAPLPTNVVDASQQIDQRCTPKAANQRSSFTITGRGGIPPSPNEPLQGESVMTHWVTLDSEQENNTPPRPTTPRDSSSQPLVEAQGWMLNEQGQVVLTAEASNVTPHHTWQPPVNCPVDSSTVRE